MVSAAEKRVEHFGHRRIANWAELSEGERYWAGYIGRRLDDRGWVKEWTYGWATMMHERTDLDNHERLDAWLSECILTALTTTNKRIAFNALLQATEYRARLQEMGVVHSLHDAYATASVRVATMLELQS